MAREEQDREDLMAEATALVERAELEIDDIHESVIVGFRGNGAACIYVGAEPVFQFNTKDQLRRIFLDGAIVKAEDGELVRLTRERTESQTVLLSKVLSLPEQKRLRELAQHYAVILRDAPFGIIRQVPTDVDLQKRIRDWAASLPDPLSVAERANVE